MLSLENIATDRPSRKLGQKFAGPFTVREMVGPNAVRLILPRTMKNHPVFLVSLVDLVSPLVLIVLLLLRIVTMVLALVVCLA